MTLNGRERQILDRLLQGDSPKEAAYALGVSRSTLVYHLRNARRRTGMKTTFQLIAAFAKGLIVLCFVSALCAHAQATWTAPVPPNSGTPGKLIITDATAGAPTITCTLTGNAEPATQITVACTGQQAFTLALGSGQSITMNFNSVPTGTAFPVPTGTAMNSVGFMLSAIPTGGIQAQAAFHGNAMVTQGTF